jgi:hypothetical protein
MAAAASLHKLAQAWKESIIIIIIIIVINNNNDTP